MGNDHPQDAGNRSSVIVEAVSKQFDDFLALDRVSVSCDAGSVLALVGPSGCGKTTLLRCIAGLEFPTGGRILIGDRDITDVAAQDRGVAMVFQNYALYPSKTVAENIGFPLRMAKVPFGERKRRVTAIAEILQIEELLSRRPSELSGGQKQRVGIGRALVRGPEVLLMDEPLSNLDAELRVEMRGDLLSLQRELGMTTVYVTHDLTEAMTLGDNLAVIQSGKLQQAGAPKDVYESPNSVSVAQFLGGMNLLGGRVTGAGFQLDGGPVIGLPDAVATKLPSSQVTLGVRPEHLTLNEGVASQFRVSGEVALVELLGAEQMVHLSLGGDRRLRVRASSDTPIVGMACAEFGKVHVFDESGARIGTVGDLLGLDLNVSRAEIG